MKKFKVIQIRRFQEGSLISMNIKHEYLSFESESMAWEEALSSIGMEFGGGWLGSRGTVVDAFVVVI